MSEEKPVDRRFIFNGSAVALGGRIRRPDDMFLRSAAVAHLSVTGGLSEAHLKGPDVAQYHYKDYLKFGEAYSRAQGDFSDPKRAVEYTHDNHGQNPLPAVTTVESRLHDLEIDAEADADTQTPRRIFRAKSLSVNMQTTISAGSDESTIRAFTATYEGLSLATGDSAPIALNVLLALQIFTENETKAKLTDRYAKDGDFRKRYAACFHPLGQEPKSLIGSLVSKHGIPHADVGPVVATFVTGLQWVGEAPTGTEILNNRLTIPGLGRIYFGEIIIHDRYQRTSLLRFELGSRIGGSAGACEASSNGTHWPPVGS